MAETEDFELAAALVSALGEPVPHDAARETEAAALLQGLADDRQVLKKAAALCGKPEEPKQFYLCEKIYSLLGRDYDAETVRCAEAYLASPGWEALPSGQTLERGVKVDLSARVRAGVLMDLGGAYAGLGQEEKACAVCLRAYELEPYRAEYAVSVSGALVKSGKTREALDFLLLQKSSPYYRPVRYRGAGGEPHSDTGFRNIIDAQILRVMKRLEDGGK